MITEKKIKHLDGSRECAFNGIYRSDRYEDYFIDSTHEEKEFTLQKGESFMHRKNQQQEAAYYNTIAESIKDYDEVLLFGPPMQELNCSIF